MTPRHFALAVESIFFLFAVTKVSSFGLSAKVFSSQRAASFKESTSGSTTSSLGLFSTRLFDSELPQDVELLAGTSDDGDKIHHMATFLTLRLGRSLLMHNKQQQQTASEVSSLVEEEKHHLLHKKEGDRVLALEDEFIAELPSMTSEKKEEETSLVIAQKESLMVEPSTSYPTTTTSLSSLQSSSSSSSTMSLATKQPSVKLKGVSTQQLPVDSRDIPLAEPVQEEMSDTFVHSGSDMAWDEFKHRLLAKNGKVSEALSSLTSRSSQPIKEEVVLSTTTMQETKVEAKATKLQEVEKKVAQAEQSNEQASSVELPILSNDAVEPGAEVSSDFVELSSQNNRNLEQPHKTIPVTSNWSPFRSQKVERKETVQSETSEPLMPSRSTERSSVDTTVAMDNEKENAGPLPLVENVIAEENGRKLGVFEGIPSKEETKKIHATRSNWSPFSSPKVADRSVWSVNSWSPLEGMTIDFNLPKIDEKESQDNKTEPAFQSTLYHGVPLDAAIKPLEMRKNWLPFSSPKTIDGSVWSGSSWSPPAGATIDLNLPKVSQKESSTDSESKSEPQSVSLDDVVENAGAVQQPTLKKNWLPFSNPRAIDSSAWSGTTWSPPSGATIDLDLPKVSRTKEPTLESKLKATLQSRSTSISSSDQVFAEDLSKAEAPKPSSTKKDWSPFSSQKEMNNTAWSGATWSPADEEVSELGEELPVGRGPDGIRPKETISNGEMRHVKPEFEENLNAAWESYKELLLSSTDGKEVEAMLQRAKMGGKHYPSMGIPPVDESDRLHATQTHWSPFSTPRPTNGTAWTGSTWSPVTTGMVPSYPSLTNDLSTRQESPTKSDLILPPDSLQESKAMEKQRFIRPISFNTTVSAFDSRRYPSTLALEDIQDDYDDSIQGILEELAVDHPYFEELKRELSSPDSTVDEPLRQLAFKKLNFDESDNDATVMSAVSGSPASSTSSSLRPSSLWTTVPRKYPSEEEGGQGDEPNNWSGVRWSPSATP